MSRLSKVPSSLKRNATFAWAARRLRLAKSPWARACGPSHAIILSAVRLGIRMRTPTQCDIAGVSVDLRLDGARRVEELVRTATVSWSISRGLQAQESLLWEPVAKGARAMSPLAAKLARTQFAEGSWCAEKLSLALEALSATGSLLVPGSRTGDVSSPHRTSHSTRACP
eukprot:4603030-Amphidinium_carterae.1